MRALAFLLLGLVIWLQRGRREPNGRPVPAG